MSTPDEVHALRVRLGLDEHEPTQAQDPAGYARRWRIRSGRSRSLVLDVDLVRELVDAAAELAALKGRQHEAASGLPTLQDIYAGALDTATQARANAERFAHDPVLADMFERVARKYATAASTCAAAITARDHTLRAMAEASAALQETLGAEQEGTPA